MINEFNEDVFVYIEGVPTTDSVVSGKVTNVTDKIVTVVTESGSTLHFEEAKHFCIQDDYYAGIRYYLFNDEYEANSFEKSIREFKAIKEFFDVDFLLSWNSGHMTEFQINQIFSSLFPSCHEPVSWKQKGDKWIAHYRSNLGLINYEVEFVSPIWNVSVSGSSNLAYTNHGYSMTFESTENNFAAASSAAINFGDNIISIWENDKKD